VDPSGSFGEGEDCAPNGSVGRDIGRMKRGEKFRMRSAVCENCCCFGFGVVGGGAFQTATHLLE